MWVTTLYEAHFCIFTDMVPVFTSEMLAPSCKTTWCHNLEGHNFIAMKTTNTNTHANFNELSL